MPISRCWTPVVSIYDLSSNQSHTKWCRWLGIGEAASSPVTVVFHRAGFGAATHVVNAVLLTAVLSVMNSCYYASSRILLALARNGQAPRIFGRVNKRGIPVPALLWVGITIHFFRTG